MILMSLLYILLGIIGLYNADNWAFVSVLYITAIIAFTTMKDFKGIVVTIIALVMYTFMLTFTYLNSGNLEIEDVYYVYRTYDYHDGGTVITVNSELVNEQKLLTNREYKFDSAYLYSHNCMPVAHIVKKVNIFGVIHSEKNILCAKDFLPLSHYDMKIIYVD
jgi:hypothetical protein